FNGKFFSRKTNFKVFSLSKNYDCIGLYLFWLPVEIVLIDQKPSRNHPIISKHAQILLANNNNRV
ncbi:hypothetical protein DERP_011187, partial [Dermatophagoides pteronyssinus]